MLPVLRPATRFLAAAFALNLVACSSSGDAVQSAPAVGSGGSSAPGSGGRPDSAGGTGNGGMTSGGAGTSSGSAGAGGTPPTVVPPAPLPALHVEGNAIKDPKGNTVILRGVDLIDLAATEQWEGGIKKMIDRLTDPSDTQGSSPGWATRVLRLAVLPGDSTSGTPVGYVPGIQYYERFLRPTVDYALQKGLYAIIDWHYVDDTLPHQATTTAFWQDIAPHFAGDTNVLFELYNEPTNDGSWALTKSDMQTWYDTVRAAAPDNLVLVGTPNWSQLVGDAAADPLSGTNIVYVAHMYPQHWQSQSLRNQITTAAQTVPVFMTEWGFWTVPMDPLLNGSITTYGAPLRDFIEANHVSWSAWCASSSWAPPMFDKTYALRVGEGEMGGFVKDWLYDRRNDDLPAE
jgi:endoglucanase